MSERFFILDGPGFLFRAYHALPFLSTSKSIPGHTVSGHYPPLTTTGHVSTPQQPLTSLPQ